MTREKRRFLDEADRKLEKALQMPPRSEKFLAELKVFCDQKPGRRAELARFLTVPRQTITDLLNGRQNPTGEQILAIQDWLDQQRNK
jgi:transcriptional regulator with XRE-family HTH domain